MPKARTNGAATRGNGRGSVKATIKRVGRNGKVTEVEMDLAGEVPKVGPEHIPTNVIDELREGCRIAKDCAGAFSDACKAQAEKYKCAPGALKTYIRALEGDKLEEAERVADDLSTLIDTYGQRA